jgi:hypothetical protein
MLNEDLCVLPVRTSWFRETYILGFKKTKDKVDEIWQLGSYPHLEPIPKRLF